MGELALIFGFVLCISGMKHYFNYKTRITDLEGRVDSSEKINMQEEMASIQHRLVVLEKIITDKGYQLHEEFEELKTTGG